MPGLKSPTEAKKRLLTTADSRGIAAAPGLVLDRGERPCRKVFLR